MAVPRAKKKKTGRKPKSGWEYVKQTTYLNLAIVIRELFTVNGFSKEEIDEFLEGYVALMDEMDGKRNTVAGIVKDTKDLTGIDVKKVLDEVFDRRERKNG